MTREKTVFILGAGASREAGAPLLCDFLDYAYDVKKHRYVFPDEKDFDLVFRGINELQAANYKALIDVENIESILSAFEMARLLGRLGTLTADEVNRLPGAAKLVIARTLELTINFAVKDNKILPPQPYDEFAKLIDDMERVSQLDLVTFNYDICLDYALCGRNISVSYALGGDYGLNLLKLHGSLNWTLCPDCQKVIPWHLQTLFEENRKFCSHKGTKLQTFQMVRKKRHCDDRIAREPMIVPPVWEKGRHHKQLEHVWRSAAGAMLNADNIMVCGYSLPPTDYFFRYLYALSVMGLGRLKRFWVFDPDPQVKERFFALLGPGVSKRFRFEPLRFGDAIEFVRSEMGIERARSQTQIATRFLKVNPVPPPPCACS